MRENIQSLPMSEVAVFAENLAKNLFMFYSDIDNQVKDKVAKSLLSTNGCNSVAIKRLNSSQDWVGNIFCEFTDETDLMKMNFIRSCMKQRLTYNISCRNSKKIKSNNYN